MAQQEAFPVPFSGIRLRVEFAPSSISAMVVALIECGHGHNFAVEQGLSQDRPAILTTQSGAKCLQKAFREWREQNG